MPLGRSGRAPAARQEPARAPGGMAVLIRLAGKDDAGQIASIYRPYVEESRISFEESAPDVAEIARRMSGPIHPWLVAEDGGRIVGYASTSPMRDRSAYRW